MRYLPLLPKLIVTLTCWSLVVVIQVWDVTSLVCWMLREDSQEEAACSMPMHLLGVSISWPESSLYINPYTNYLFK